MKRTAWGVQVFQILLNIFCRPFNFKASGGDKRFPYTFRYLLRILMLTGVRVTQSLVLCVWFIVRCLSFCTFSFWSLCCLFFFDIRILITPLVSSNSSYLLLFHIKCTVFLSYIHDENKVINNSSCSWTCGAVVGPVDGCINSRKKKLWIFCLVTGH